MTAPACFILLSFFFCKKYTRIFSHQKQHLYKRKATEKINNKKHVVVCDDDSLKNLKHICVASPLIHSYKNFLFHHHKTGVKIHTTDTINIIHTCSIQHVRYLLLFIFYIPYFIIFCS